jgi:hypothetical protein
MGYPRFEKASIDTGTGKLLIEGPCPRDEDIDNTATVFAFAIVQDKTVCLGAVQPGTQPGNVPPVSWSAEIPSEDLKEEYPATGVGIALVRRSEPDGGYSFQAITWVEELNLGKP